MKRMLVALATAGLAGLVLVVSASSATAPTTAEAADLQYMREEEKLARDVYTELAKKWGDATIFARIARSEQRHMDAVKVVLDRYGIEDPAAGKPAGDFVDPELQELYDDLVARGMGSLPAALAVGVTIEKADIADLEAALAATDNADLVRLYGSLLRGSKNHLAAFTAAADGTVPAQAGRGKGQGYGRGQGAGVGPGAQLGSGTCTGDGPQAQGRQRANRGHGLRAGMR